MSELVDCTDGLTAKDIIRSVAKTANGMPFYLQTLGLAGYSEEYQAVYDAFPDKPSDADAAIQATMLDALVAGGYYAKAEFIDIFSAHSNASSLFNWRNPGTFNPSLVLAPAWVQYEGYTGAAGNYINLNFNCATQGTIIGQNNICLLIGVGNNVSEVRYDVGAIDAAKGLYIRSKHTTNISVFSCNSGLVTDPNTNGKKHFGVSRTVGANFDSYQNKVRVNKAAASVGLVNMEMYACAYNNNGVPQNSTRQLRYAMLFSYLAEAEVFAVIDIMEAYLDNYGTGLIP